MKADLRIQKTKDRLYKSLIELMEQIPFYEIRIVTLLQHSGVSKNTFYRHYQSLYELYYEMMDLTMHSFCHALRKKNPPLHVNPSYALTLQSLHYQRILTIALKSTSPNILVDLLQKHYRQIDAPHIERQLTFFPSEYAQYLDPELYYGLGSITTLHSISYVLAHPHVPIDELAQTLYANSYLYEKVCTRHDFATAGDYCEIP